VPIRLCISTEHPFAIAWSVALAGAALSVGYGSMIAGLTILRGALPSFGHIRPALIGAIVIGAVMAFVGILLVAFRRRFVKFSSRLQWTLAAAALATVLIPFAWLVIAQR
jgi:hypothetical protein